MVLLLLLLLLFLLVLLWLLLLLLGRGGRRHIAGPAADKLRGHYGPNDGRHDKLDDTHGARQVAKMLSPPVAVERAKHGVPSKPAAGNDRTNHRAERAQELDLP